MTLRSITHALVLVLLTLGLPGFAAAQDVGSARAQFERAAAAYADAVTAVDDVRERFELETLEINRIKDGSAGVLDVFELRRALRSAQATAETLVIADGTVQARRAELDRRRQALVVELRAELGWTERAVRDARGTDRALLATQVAQLRAEIQQRSVPLPVRSAAPIAAIVAGLSDDPDELRDAAAELRDHEIRLQRQVEELRERIRVDAVAARLSGAEARFGAEEGFLDEQSMRRGPPRALGRTETASDATGTPSRSTENPAPPAEEDLGVAEGAPAGNDGAGGEPVAPDQAGTTDGTSPPLGSGPVETPAFEVDDRAGDDGDARGTRLGNVDDPLLFVRERPSAGRAGRARTGSSLAPSLDALEAELNAVRAERERLLRQADLLDSAER